MSIHTVTSDQLWWMERGASLVMTSFRYSPLASEPTTDGPWESGTVCNDHWEKNGWGGGWGLIEHAPPRCTATAHVAHADLPRRCLPQSSLTCKDWHPPTTSVGEASRNTVVVTEIVTGMITTYCYTGRYVEQGVVLVADNVLVGEISASQNAGTFTYFITYGFEFEVDKAQMIPGNQYDCTKTLILSMKFLFLDL